ncbi:hypothetical protein [Carnobacterium divergens]|uniref:hypothetical protein n=1 Tax=Carnobacterium divergens TaxID=2748 RepID=UPI00288DABA2|nr:hypothetical protein [Carnobacterium divergens]MDT2011139.1 hypothetical protein [Carnobacterium divergens]
MWAYVVWWKETMSNRILNTTVKANSKEDAKELILQKFGYKSWDIKFTRVEIERD